MQSLKPHEPLLHPWSDSPLAGVRSGECDGHTWQVAVAQQTDVSDYCYTGEPSLWPPTFWYASDESLPIDG